MPGHSVFIGASCVLVLTLLAARALLRLGHDHRSVRAGGGRRRHRRSEAAHLAMAVGMALMFLPLPAARPALAGLFAAIVLYAAAVWVTDRVRAARARRGAAVDHCPPEHRLEPHQVVVGSAMAVMALGSRAVGTGAAAGMAAMPGMAPAGGSLTPAALLLFGYVWVSVLVLGGGLARTFRAEAGLERDLAALLGAPSTVYACELTMTVVMGLMLLS